MRHNQDISSMVSSDPQFIDDLYQKFKKDESSVDSTWRYFFQGLDFAFDHGLDQQATNGTSSTSVGTSGDLQKEFNVYLLILSYRLRGHLLSDTNPVRPRLNRLANLDIDHFDLTEEDLDKSFEAGLFLGLGKTKLRDIIDHLRRVYCYKIGIEYHHTNNSLIRNWVRNKFESEYHTIDLSDEKKERILHKLNQAQVFESFLQTKYIGQKRFSLEGGETTIAALDAAINRGAELGVKEFVFGMAHRGRLNVLANIIGKSYSFIFNEFEGGEEKILHTGGGDVKYHKGYSSIQKAANGSDVYLKIMHNPSHLEAVAPVTLGYARAQADLRYKHDQSSIVPIIIHGDAALAGQGVCYETLQMAELEAYKCSGAIHFVINNQIGFTTDFTDARSSHYSTSLARTLEAPIIHVNGDDPESVVWAMEFAVEFRQKFKTDIFVDMVCYRKHGHNEADEPKFTQPHLYGLIAKTKNPRELYAAYLSQRNEHYKELAKKMEVEFKSMLSDRFNDVKEKKVPERTKGPHTEWTSLRWSTPQDFDRDYETGVPQKELDAISAIITKNPDNFNTLKKAKRILDDRKKAYENDTLDWAMAELLAYGSLLKEKRNIRFTGQDVVRGTFSHRHSKLFDEKTNEAYAPLAHLSDDQGMFEIYNSHLSEYAVLGFEYGYSLASPDSLNIWEAQFGDFANTAQVIIDQFIASAEVKWERMSGLVLLLPHGYEGQGPEHSSARIERFLQLTAQDNMIVANPTTPANLFHLLRRQMAFEFRKPLIVFSPKSLLRHPECISTKQELANGHFQDIIDDQSVQKTKVDRVIVCQGKVYYDLHKERAEKKIKNAAIIRLEQLYPLNEKKMKKILDAYKNAKHFIFCQEEPKNMGAWSHMKFRHESLFENFLYAGRDLSATPATGLARIHQEEQARLIYQAFNLKKEK